MSKRKKPGHNRPTIVKPPPSPQGRAQTADATAGIYPVVTVPVLSPPPHLAPEMPPLSSEIDETPTLVRARVPQR